MKELLVSIGWVVLTILFVSVTLIWIGKAFPRPHSSEKTEHDFRAACGAVKGATVWNGHTWVCIK